MVFMGQRTRRCHKVVSSAPRADRGAQGGRLQACLGLALKCARALSRSKPPHPLFSRRYIQPPDHKTTAAQDMSVPKHPILGGTARTLARPRKCTSAKIIPPGRECRNSSGLLVSRRVHKFRVPQRHLGRSLHDVFGPLHALHEAVVLVAYLVAPGAEPSARRYPKLIQRRQ